MSDWEGRCMSCPVWRLSRSWRPSFTTRTTRNSRKSPRCAPPGGQPHAITPARLRLSRLRRTA
jgi:hypothetical protein